MSEPAAFDHADRPKRYVWRVSARGIAWIRKFFRARENVSRCIAAARKKIGIGVILSEVDDFVVAGINRKKGFRLLSRIFVFVFNIQRLFSA